MINMEETFQIDRNLKLGKGSYATVFGGKWGDVDVAVKRIQVDDIIDREERTMRDLDHPNVLKLLWVKEDEYFRYMILELCDATVDDYCKERYKGAMPSDRDALYQMADGLHYIHLNSLVHRDISTGNVLIKSTRSGALMKISDFGFCKPASENGSFSMSQGCKGTKRFVAPELLKLMDESKGETGEKEKPRGHIKSDVFSLGCLFFTFLTKGEHPFSNGSVHQIPINILANKHCLEKWDDGRYYYAKPLIQGMIDAVPENRLGLDKVKEKLTSLNTVFLPL